MASVGFEAELREWEEEEGAVAEKLGAPGGAHGGLRRGEGGGRRFPFVSFFCLSRSMFFPL